jgi:hypothetical protein
MMSSNFDAQKRVVVNSWSINHIVVFFGFISDQSVFSGVSNAFPYFIVNSEMCTLNS